MLSNNYAVLLLEKLAKKKVKTKCECCGKSSWSVVNQAVSVLVGDLSFLPSAGLLCNNCGNLRLFSLDVLGISFNEDEI